MNVHINGFIILRKLMQQIIVEKCIIKRLSQFFVNNIIIAKFQRDIITTKKTRSIINNQHKN